MDVIHQTVLGTPDIIDLPAQNRIAVYFIMAAVVLAEPYTGGRNQQGNGRCNAGRFP
jgi:hypothetical protein